jgi:hypothetical protein
MDQPGWRSHGPHRLDWPDPVIFRQVILPWEVRQLGQKPSN